MFVEVVFPLPFRKAFTYKVPNELESDIQLYKRVSVPFGKRTLTGVIISTSKTTNVKEEIKEVMDVLDVQPIFDKDSLKFYGWLSEYYLSSLGEALKLGFPYGADVVGTASSYTPELERDLSSPSLSDANIGVIIVVTNNIL